MKVWLTLALLLVPGLARADLFTAQGIAHGGFSGMNLGAGLVAATTQPLACVACARLTEPLRISAAMHGVAGGMELAKAGIYGGLNAGIRGDMRGEAFAGWLLAEGFLSIGTTATSLTTAVVLNETARGVRKDLGIVPLQGRFGHAVRFSVATHLVTGLAAFLDSTALAVAILVFDAERIVPEEAALRVVPTVGGLAIVGRW